jgi:hypothetical protein
MMSTTWLYASEVGEGEDQPLESYTWLEDHSLNPDSEADGGDAVDALGLSDFGRSDLDREEMDFLLLSLGAAGAFYCPHHQPATEEFTAE